MDTSLNLSLQDNVSQSSRRIASELDGIAKSADGINSKFDPSVLDEFDKKLTQIGESYTKLNNSQKRNDQQSSNGMRQAQNLVSSSGTALAQVGSGNVGGAALTAGKGLSGLTSMMGGTAMLLAGTAMAAGVGTNALASQYEQRSGASQTVATLMGDMESTDIGQNTNALRKAMAYTVASVTKYGKTYEEGAKAQETFLRAGGKDLSGSQSAAYSLARGADYQRLSSFEGMAQRYGQSDSLQLVDALRRQQGLGIGQFGEVLEGIEGAFTASLSRGAVRSMPDIMRSQEFFGRIGPTFQGALGAQRLQGMDQTVASAGGLQSESDIFLWRAATKIREKEIPEGNLIDTKILMEKEGLSARMFKGLMGEYKDFGYGEVETTLAIQNQFKVGPTVARAMYNLKDEEAISEYFKVGELPEGTGGTAETQYIGDVERLKEEVAGVLGAKAFDSRAQVVGATEDMLNAFKKFFSGFFEGANVDNMNVNNLSLEGRTRGIGIDSDVSFSDMEAGLTRSQRGVSKKTNLLKNIEEAMAGGIPKEAIMGALGARFKEYTGSSSDGGFSVTGSEQASLGGLLESLIKTTQDVADAVREDASLEGLTE